MFQFSHRPSFSFSFTAAAAAAEIAAVATTSFSLLLSPPCRPVAPGEEWEEKKEDETTEEKEERQDEKKEQQQENEKEKESKEKKQENQRRRRLKLWQCQMLANRTRAPVASSERKILKEKEKERKLASVVPVVAAVASAKPATNVRFSRVPPRTTRATQRGLPCPSRRRIATRREARDGRENERFPVPCMFFCRRRRRRSFHASAPTKKMPAKKKSILSESLLLSCFLYNVSLSLSRARARSLSLAPSLIPSFFSLLFPLSYFTPWQRRDERQSAPQQPGRRRRRSPPPRRKRCLRSCLLPPFLGPSRRSRRTA